MIYPVTQIRPYVGVNIPMMPVQYNATSAFSGTGMNLDITSFSREVAGNLGINPTAMAATNAMANQGNMGGFIQQIMQTLQSMMSGIMTVGQNLWQQGKDIINSFGQGRQGNCASIATIKGAMEKYGKNVFNKVEQTADGGYKIQMKDGKTVSLTPQELQIAKQKADFKGQRGEDQQFAELAYAAMAKRAQQEGHEGARNFSQACDTLNNGEDPIYTAKLLGLKNHIIRVNPAMAATGNGVVAWSRKHAVFQKGGALDRYGSAVAANGTDGFGNYLTDAYMFI